MTSIRIDPVRDIPGGSSSTRMNVTTQVYRNGAPAVFAPLDDILVFSARMSFVLVGVGTIPLDPIPANCYWRVGLRTRTYYTRVNVILPSSAPIIEFDKLVDVDPGINIPDPKTALSDAFLAQIDEDRIATEIARNQAVAARDGMIIGARRNSLGHLIVDFVGGGSSDLGKVTGENGVDGAGLSILGTFSSTAQLPITGNPGDAYLIGGQLYVWVTSTHLWDNVGSVQGPAGEGVLIIPTGGTVPPGTPSNTVIVQIL